MHDFDLTDSDHNQIDYGSVIGTDTVIVSHAVDPMTELSYYRYLQGLGQRVVLLASKDNPLVHIMNESHRLGFDTYNDPNRHLITELRDRWNLEPDSKALCRLLRFQILYRNGREVGAWYQPVTQQWKHFMEDNDAAKAFVHTFGTYGTNWLQKQDKENHLLWTGYSQNAYSAQFTTPDPRFEVFFKYYNLMPNKQLAAMLENQG
jgi:hypothetical protein